MKYLTDYTRESQSKAMEQFGAFFAFSNEQLEEKRVQGVEYCNMGGGLIAPVGNADALYQALNRVIDDGRKMDMEENGRRKIIERELMNHECYYTGDLEPCVQGLALYGITAEEIRLVYKELLPTIDL
jgi:hypothetical protein